jgi:hypothetical protein
MPVLGMVSMRLKVAAGVNLRDAGGRETDHPSGEHDRSCKRRMVLCAYGISLKGERRFLDFRLLDSESQASWEAFLHQLCEAGSWASICGSSRNAPCDRASPEEGEAVLERVREASETLP